MGGGIKIPETLFLSQWVVRGAPQLLGAYPKKDLDYNLIIDLFGLILREEEEPKEGFYIVQYPKDAAFSEEYGGRYFVCYFSGMELRQLVGLILEPKEDPGPYRGALVREALRLFRRGEVPSTDEEWERIWNAILTYPQLPLERRIADIFRDVEARIILTTMINEGVTTLDELVRSLKEGERSLDRLQFARVSAEGESKVERNDLLSLLRFKISACNTSVIPFIAPLEVEGK